MEQFLDVAWISCGRCPPFVNKVPLTWLEPLSTHSFMISLCSESRAVVVSLCVSTFQLWNACVATFQLWNALLYNIVMEIVEEDKMTETEGGPPLSRFLAFFQLNNSSILAFP